jgi:Holliday junction resolvase RusA-like endonuclease
VSTAPVTVIVDGAAVAKGRARVTRRGFVYTPAATRKYEAYAKLAAGEAMAGRPPITAPVRVELLVVLAPPGSWSGRRRAAATVGDVLPTSRPDLDNYIKSISDAINTVVIVDDSQIVELRARKRYGVAPKLIATVFPIDAEGSHR